MFHWALSTNLHNEVLWTGVNIGSRNLVSVLRTFRYLYKGFEDMDPNLKVNMNKRTTKIESTLTQYNY